MFETIAKALFDIIDSLMGLFQFGHMAERRMSESSRLGESRWDRDAHTWQRKVLYSWWFICIAIGLLSAGGAYLWHYFTK